VDDLPQKGRDGHLEMKETALKWLGFERWKYGFRRSEKYFRG